MLPNLQAFNTDHRNIDKAKAVEFEQALRGKTKRFKTTAWLYLTRGLHFARKSKAIDYRKNTALAAIAIRTRKTATKEKNDGGFVGFLRQMKAKGLSCNHDPKSIRKVEDLLESVGAIEVQRNGLGKVTETTFNLRACALLLEILHPDWELLQDKVGGLFNWLKGFCGEILGHRFNRRDAEGDLYDGQHIEQDLAAFEAVYPTVKLSWEEIPLDAVKAFKKFCRGVVRELKNICVFWDVDISSSPTFSE